MKLMLYFLIAARLVAAAGVNYTYDAAGHLIAANYGNGSVITYAYDPAGNLISRSVQGGGPAITSVTTAYAGPVIAQNTFIVIKGANLVPATTPASGAIWSAAPSFASGLMPTQLNSVSVTVNNKPAFVYFYCSAVTDPACAQDQLNILTPLDNTIGPVPVVVTNGGVSSPPFTANMQAVAPSFLLFSTAGYVAATHANNSLVGPTSLYPGSSTPAAPGETIILYAVGFGLPATPLVNGSSSQSGSLPMLPVCQVGGNAAALTFAGLNGFPGLYQLNITIPATAVNGDNAVGCTYNGSSTPAGDLITVQVSSNAGIAATVVSQSCIIDSTRTRLTINATGTVAGPTGTQFGLGAGWSGSPIQYPTIDYSQLFDCGSWLALQYAPGASFTGIYACQQNSPSSNTTNWNGSVALTFGAPFASSTVVTASVQPYINGISTSAPAFVVCAQGQ